MALERVLLAVGKDDEDRVNRLGEAAIDIAGPAGASVTIARIFTESDYHQTREQLGYDPDSEVTPDVVARRQIAVKNLGDSLEEAGLEFNVRGRTSTGSSVGERIVQLAEDTGADLVIVGGRNRSPTGKAVFGSTAQEVMLNAPCPVTFVRTGD